MSRRKMNIVFIGFMGSGKSSTSKYLAKLLKRKVFSTDQLIVKKEKRSIARIFSEEGEPYFRKLEERTVAQIANKKNIIIDCGGGIVLNPKNIKRLKKNGILIYLKTSPEWIWRRVLKTKRRPLLSVENPQKKIRELLKRRKSLYAQANVTIVTDAKTPGQVATKVKEKLKL